jgi:general secretion pathway protein J
MTRRRQGFTLIELLVAISILAIVAVLGWRGLDGIIRSRSALTSQMEQTRGLQLAFAQMQSDCENLASSSQLHGRAYLQVEDNRITLVRMVLAENQATQLQVVAYRVRDGVLTRRESSATRDLQQLDSLWQAVLSDTDPAASVALQSGVQTMGMRFWINSEWQPAAGISTATSAAAGVQIPQALPASPTGMEVALSLQGQEIPIVKSFLLGAL